MWKLNSEKPVDLKNDPALPEMQGIARNGDSERQDLSA